MIKMSWMKNTPSTNTQVWKNWSMACFTNELMRWMRVTLMISGTWSKGNCQTSLRSSRMSANLSTRHTAPLANFRSSTTGEKSKSFWWWNTILKWSRNRETSISHQKRWIWLPNQDTKLIWEVDQNASYTIGKILKPQKRMRCTIWGSLWNKSISFSTGTDSWGSILWKTSWPCWSTIFIWRIDGLPLTRIIRSRNSTFIIRALRPDSSKNSGGNDSSEWPNRS